MDSADFDAVMWSAKSSADSLEQEMRRLQLDALKKGVLTDYSFLVGPEKDDAAEVSHLIL